MNRLFKIILLVSILALAWVSIAAAEAGDADIEGQITAVNEVGLTITVETLDGIVYLVSFPPEYEFDFTAEDIGTYVHVVGEFLDEVSVLAESVTELEPADIEGEIIAVDEAARTITVKTEGGEEYLVRFPSDYEFGFTAEDVGTCVHVIGVFLGDGSILAESVEIVEPPEDGDGEKHKNAYCSGQKGYPHPVALAIANAYQVPVEEIMGYFCNGYGFGQIILALETSKITGIDVPTLLASREEGKGWGEIWKELGFTGRPKEAKEDKVPPGQQKKTNQAEDDIEQPGKPENPSGKPDKHPGKPDWVKDKAKKNK